MNKLSWLSGVVFCLLLSACSHEIPPGNYDSTEVGKIKKVVPGTIISKRAVKFHNKNVESGAIDATKTPTNEYVDGGNGYVYVIKLNSGAIVSVAQAEDLKLKVKQHVLVVYGKHTRILPDYGSDE